MDRRAVTADAVLPEDRLHVAREEHYYEETDTTHSHWIDSKDYKYVGVTSWRLKPGARGDLMAALDKIQKAITDAKWPYPYRLAWLIGGEDRLRVVVPMKSYAEMADPDPSVHALLAKSLGSEEAAGSTLKQFGGALEDAQYTVFAYRPDLAAQ